MKTIITLFASCFFLLNLNAQPYPLSLLKDINPGSNSSDAGAFIEMNGIKYFSANTANEGRELWRTNGTAAGTYLVKDINAGTANGFTSQYPAKLNNKIYFSAETTANGSELWSSDGTAAGTKMVADINPGTAGSYIFSITIYNSKLYFVASNAAYGSELWSSDGTAAGTHIVKDINPGAGSTSIYSTQMFVVNDKLLFSANDGTNGYRLWATDGTTAGTKILSNTSNAYGLTGSVMNDNIYYAANVSGVTQIWKSNGTESGTVLVADISPGVSTNEFTNFVTVGNNVFFRTRYNYVGKELWKTDGTTAGTVMVKDMSAVAPDGNFSPIYMLAYDNNTLLFTCNYTFYGQSNPYGCELWKSDGTNAGTKLVRSFTELSGVGLYPNSFTKYNGKYYFMAYKSSGVLYELWKTDATPAGTVTVRNTSQYDGSYPTSITIANGLLYYITWGATGSSNYGIWQSDGTDAGTQKITETGAGCQDRPSTLLIFPDKAVMFAKALENGTANYYGEEPYVTNIPAKPACTQHKTPSITITSNNADTVCPGTPVIFNASFNNGGTTPQFQWRKNGVNISWATGSTVSINSLNNNDTISCVLTSNADCITTVTAVSNKIISSVYPQPEPTISANGPTTFCRGGSVRLTSSQASSYLWSNGATTRSITVDTSGSFSVMITSSTGCKGTSAVKTVTVNPLPSPTITAGTATTFCQGGNVTLTSSGASSYLWNNGATTKSIIVSSSGNYNVTVTNASGCSAASSSIAVTVNPLPVPTVTPNGSTTFCVGGSVTLSSSPASYYTWYNDQDQPLWYQKDYVAVNAGNYYVKVGDVNGCEGSSALTTVTTNPQPQPTITPSGPTTFCQGGSVILTSSSASSYLWNNGATAKSITVSTAGNYSVTVTNAKGCSGISGTINVSVNSLPPAIITASGPATFCEGGNVKLTSSTANSYLWSNGATTKSITVKTSGNYTVTVSDYSTGCSNTSIPSAITVKPLPIPTVTASGATTGLCPGTAVTLTSSSASSYLWSNGATTQSITVSTAGKYYVTVTNAAGCSGKSSNTNVTYLTCPSPRALKAKLNSATSVTFTWNAASCGSSFRLQYKPVSASSFKTVNTTATTYIANNLLPGTTYQWQVATVCQSAPLIISAYAQGSNFTTASAIAAVNNEAGQKNMYVELFPNPAESYATLRLSGSNVNAAVTVRDVTGKILLQYAHVQQQINIPLQHIANGIYLVTIINGSEIKTIKLVKE